MTHDGPFGSATARAQKRLENEPKGELLFGSRHLMEMVHTLKDRLVVNVHGHDHYGSFTDYIRENECVKVPIVNPGSLNFKDYGVMKIAKDQASQKWVVKELTKKFIL